MKLIDLQAQITKDAKIDATDLINESSRTPYMHGRYINFLSDLRIMEKNNDLAMKKLIHRKWLWMNGKASQEELEKWGYEPFQLKILKQDFDMFLEADEEFVALLDEQKEIKAKLEMVLEFIKSINNRNFIIRAMIDYQKMMNGG